MRIGFFSTVRVVSLTKCMYFMRNFLKHLGTKFSGQTFFDTICLEKVV